MDKERLRAGMRAGSKVDPATELLVVSGLFVWLSGRLPGTIAAYLAFGHEVDVESLFSRLPGWQWVLPRVEEDGSLTWRDRDLPREVHRWGMTQPVDQGERVPVTHVDIFLVPGLAFDESGARLGRGGGHYDRALAVRRGDSEAVGVTFESRVLPSLPVDGHDERMGWLATENGVRRCMT